MLDFGGVPLFVVYNTFLYLYSSIIFTTLTPPDSPKDVDLQIPCVFLGSFQNMKKNCEMWKLNGCLLPAFLNPMVFPIFWLVSQNWLVLKETTNRWVFPKIVVPQNGWFIMENPIKMGWFRGKTHHLRKHSDDSNRTEVRGNFLWNLWWRHCGYCFGGDLWGRERLNMFFWGGGWVIQYISYTYILNYIDIIYIYAYGYKCKGHISFIYVICFCICVCTHWYWGS